MAMFERAARRRGGAWTAMLMIAVLAAAVMGWAPAAHGQGVDQLVPKPITTGELLRYSGRLDLSDDQWTALERMHERYKADYQAVREGPIAELERKMREMEQSSSMMMPDREQVEAFMRGLETVNERIGRLDEGFFDEVATMLSEAQARQLPRLRLLRERMRYGQNQMGWMTGGPPMDLSELVEKSAMEEASRARIDPTVAAYERQLTGLLRKLYEGQTRMVLDMLEAFERAGLAEMQEDMDWGDMEKAQEFQRRIEEVMREVMEKQLKLQEEIGELNDRTISTLRSSLPGGDGRTLHMQYLLQAHSNIAHPLRVVEEETARDLLKRFDEELSKEEKEGLRAAAATYDAARDRLIEKTEKTAKEFARDRSPFGMANYDWQAVQEATQDLMADATQARNDHVEAVRLALGDERTAALQQKRIEEGIAAQQEAGGPEASWGRTYSMDEREEMPGAGTGDMLIARAMSRRELREMLDRMEADAAQRTVAQELHRAYRERFRELPELEKIREANQNLWSVSANGEMKPPTEQAIDRQAAARRDAVEAVARQERELFDSITAALTLNEEQAAVLATYREARERQAVRGDEDNVSYPRGGPMGMAAESVDVGRLLLKQDDGAVDGAAIASARPALEAYHERTMELLRERLAAQVEYDAAQMRWTARSMEAQAGGEALDYTAYEEIVQRPMNALQQKDRDASAIDAEAIDALEGSMSAEAYSAVLTAHRRAAHPSVFQDPQSMQRHLDRAMDLPDLSGEQRTELAEMAAAYRNAYMSLCLKLIDLYDGYDTTGWGTQDFDWQSWSKLSEQAQRIQFERSELSAKTMGRLKVLLSDDQFNRLGPMPDFEPDMNPW